MKPVFQEMLLKLGFVALAAIAYGYFSAYMSPSPNLKSGQKIEQSYTVGCNGGECKFTKTTFLTAQVDNKKR